MEAEAPFPDDSELTLYDILKREPANITYTAYEWAHILAELVREGFAVEAAVTLMLPRMIHDGPTDLATPITVRVEGEPSYWRGLFERAHQETKGR